MTSGKRSTAFTKLPKALTPGNKHLAPWNATPKPPGRRPPPSGEPKLQKARLRGRGSQPAARASRARLQLPRRGTASHGPQDPASSERRQNEHEAEKRAKVRGERRKRGAPLTGAPGYSWGERGQWGTCRIHCCVTESPGRSEPVSSSVKSEYLTDSKCALSSHFTIATFGVPLGRVARPHI